MNPQDISADVIARAARAMTAGAPRPDFTDRVMAPIYGRPRRDFVARVMAGIASAPQAVARRTSAPVVGPAFAAAALVLGALAILWRPVDVVWPATNAPAARNPRPPDAPRIATAAPPDASPAATVATPALPRPSRPRAQAAEYVTAATAHRPPVMRTIDPLAAPATIALRTIAPEPVTVPALATPSPLTIPVLRVNKEKR